MEIVREFTERGRKELAEIVSDMYWVGYAINCVYVDEHAGDEEYLMDFDMTYARARESLDDYADMVSAGVDLIIMGEQV